MVKEITRFLMSLMALVRGFIKLVSFEKDSSILGEVFAFFVHCSSHKCSEFSQLEQGIGNRALSGEKDPRWEFIKGGHGLHSGLVRYRRKPMEG